ncbi:MAG: hypothetical protein EXS36_09525 [Pedosphaera sp.]|nr:hypothetical protein [Pedosphaera sp.]
MAVLTAASLLVDWLLVPCWRFSTPESRPLWARPLDLVEAAMHRRVALQLETGDEWEKARWQWRLAIAHHPCNSDFEEHLLANVLHAPRRDSSVRELALGHARWLATPNRPPADRLRLVSRVFEHFQADQRLVSLLESLPSESGPLRDVLLARARVRLGDELLSPELIHRLCVDTEDSESELYRLAVVSWGSDIAAGEAAAKLTGLVNGPCANSLSIRLGFYRALREEDISGATRLLDRLDSAGASTPLDHATLWRRLIHSRLPEEARRRAQNFLMPPVSSHELIEVTRGFWQMDEEGLGLAYLDRYLEVGAGEPVVWRIYGGHLLRAQRWDDVRMLATRLLANPIARRPLAGLADYFEGMAAHGHHQALRAANLFSAAAGSSLDDPESAWIVAQDVVRLGYAVPGRAWLRSRMEQFSRLPGYWLLLRNTAESLQDAELLALAVRGLHRSG